MRVSGTGKKSFEQGRETLFILFSQQIVCEVRLNVLIITQCRNNTKWRQIEIAGGINIRVLGTIELTSYRFNAGFPYKLSYRR